MFLPSDYRESFSQYKSEISMFMVYSVLPVNSLNATVMSDGPGVCFIIII